MSKIGKFLSGFLMGGILGGILAMLLTPLSGEEMRTRIQEKYDFAKLEVQKAAEARSAELQQQLAALQKKKQ